MIICIFTLLGHGGRQIADFLEETLEKNIAVELKEPDDATILERISRSDNVMEKKWNFVDIKTVEALGLDYSVFNNSSILSPPCFNLPLI